MSQQNELTPLPAGNNAGGSEAHREQAGGARASAGRLKTPAEISAAIDLVMALISTSLMPEKQGRVVLQALKLQLDCTLAGGDDAAAAEFVADVKGAAEIFNKNPDLLRVLASTMVPEYLTKILQAVRPGQ